MIHYTPEIEGGYTPYECSLPISDKRVVFPINRDGTPGEAPFDLSKCTIIRSGIRSGNLHWE